MKILFLTTYSRLGASTRYRALQYFPYLQANGWSISWQPYLSDAYIQHLYSGGTRSASEAAKALVRRLRYLCVADLKRFDVIHVQAEALRRIPFWLESTLLRYLERLVLDYDDAVFEPYQSNPLLRKKLPQLANSAAHVVVANDYLRAYFSRFSTQVSVLPTVIDLSKYQVKDTYKWEPGHRVVIGWIGSPATIGYLAAFSGVLQLLSERYPILLRCVGAPADFSISGVRLEHMPWSEETEAHLVRTFDIGIMPLVDDPLARGKSGLKLLQYMGCAVPTVGSAIGANCQIVKDGLNGFLASSEREWAAAMVRLISDADLRRRLGQSGRETVASRYSLQAVAPRFCRLLTDIATAGSKARIACSSFAGQ